MLGGYVGGGYPSRPSPSPGWVRGDPGLDRVPGRLGGVLPPRRRGPPDVPAGELVGLPPRVLLHPVVMPALGREIVKTTHVRSVATALTVIPPAHRD